MHCYSALTKARKRRLLEEHGISVPLSEVEAAARIAVLEERANCQGMRLDALEKALCGRHPEEER